MNIKGLISAKRDGLKHTKPELEWLANDASNVPDYQLSAWLMAAYLHPLDEEETAWLTLAMAGSGDRLDRSGLPRPWIDKHSTGGVGDKTSIVLLPLLAACGLNIVKMSGRGLGITGGTVDKLLSVPGFRMDLSVEELKDQARRIGVAITGQTPNLAPADKVFYALRDATETVDSIPLIVSSILSKKIAGGAEIVVLDVKAGSGAFMPNVESARKLASALMRTAKLAGIKSSVAITDMSQPLGRTVGNALEIEEAGKVLAGIEPSRFTDLCLDLAGLTLVAAGLAATRAEGREKARLELISHRALAKAQEWFEAQGGDPAVLVRPDLLPQASHTIPVIADRGGWVAEIRADSVGEAVIDLGGGRRTKEDAIDPSVGVEIHHEVGMPVEVGHTVMTIHSSSEESGKTVAESLRHAVRISNAEVKGRAALIEVIA